MTKREPCDFFEAEKLHRAAAEGNIPEMEKLVREGRKLNVLDDLSRGPLHYAVAGEHYKAVGWLIAQGADVNLYDAGRIGETALCVAAQSEYPEMVELLLRNGADPDIKGWMGQTARSRAKKRKDPEGREIAAMISQFHSLPVELERGKK